jgi:hypothetical protein
MHPIWADKDQRALRIEALAVLIGIARSMRNTAFEMRALSQLMRNVRHVDELFEPLGKVWDTLESDMLANKYLSPIYQSLSVTFQFHLENVGSEDLYKHNRPLINIFKIGKPAEDNTWVLRRMINRTADEYEKLLIYCFQYLTTIEGNYDQSLRVAYLLASIAYGRPRQLPNERGLDIETMKTFLEGLMGKDGAKPLFEGYNRHLRNSIAHLHFEYKPAEKKMIYSDYNNGIRTSGPDEITLAELTELDTKAGCLYNCMAYFIMYLIVHDLTVCTTYI